MSLARRVVLALALAAVGFALGTPVAAQCAMCKATLTGAEEGPRIWSSFNHAILLMFAAPYAVFGTVAGVMLRHRLRSRLLAWRDRFRSPALAGIALLRPAHRNRP